jgi:UDP-N-acetylglucosamine 2-epimerase (non-hydrolysing)/GDP/UDP-N,N'-diacetylbacillosamine 2-epimerase (hydrolysing)
MNTRKIAVVTGTRADYGLLRWLMNEIDARADLELQVMATGMHLAPEFGSTWQAIVEDGFSIDERIEMLLSSDTSVGVAKSVGIATMGFADAFARLSPDIVVVLGDRFEILAATQAALIMRLPLAHIAGGETTEGAIDDAIRHAITKMSNLHFTAADAYRERVIQMGEQPALVFQVGAVGLDNFERLTLMGRRELSDALDVEFDDRPLVLCTFHPETRANESPQDALGPLFQALHELDTLRIVFTKGNADSGGHEMNRLIDEFVTRHAERTAAFTSLGQLKYLSLLSAADVVVGNSSSGIVEAPTAGTPTVNIGDRQKGRLRAPSIIDSSNETFAIREAIERALSDDFVLIAAEKISPFGAAGASIKIADVLANVNLDSLRTKKFYTMPTEGQK